MSCAKIVITIDQGLLRRLDRLVQSRVYPNRSAAIQEAVRDRLEKHARTRLAVECAKLDPVAEGAMAEEAIGMDFSR